MLKHIILLLSVLALTVSAESQYREYDEASEEISLFEQIKETRGKLFRCWEYSGGMIEADLSEPIYEICRYDKGWLTLDMPFVSGVRKAGELMDRFRDSDLHANVLVCDWLVQSNTELGEGTVSCYCRANACNHPFPFNAFVKMNLNRSYKLIDED